MPENLENLDETTQNSESTASDADTESDATQESGENSGVSESQPEPSLEEDFEVLQKLNLLKVTLVRMQGGRHPDPEIEALLQRRLNLSRDSFQGPYVIRLISTLIMIFIAATICWGILWILAFELSYFIRILSTGMASLVAALAGVAIFHPTSLPDENLLKQRIEEEMGKISKKVQQDINDSEEVSGKKEPLVDSNIEELNKSSAENHLQSEDPLVQMPKFSAPMSSQDGTLRDDELNDDNVNISTDTTLNQEEEAESENEQKPQAETDN